MSKHLNPDVVFNGFRTATMADSDIEFACHFSGRPIERCVHHVDYGLLENVAIGVADGEIAWLALEKEIPESVVPKQRIDGNQALLMPGLIDCHTHLIYGGNRAAEWEMRLNGISYEEISRAGGGILSTVRATRAATEEELFKSASKRLKRLMSQGVTTFEIKSGYGLDLETELKMLRVARQLEEQFPVSVESTFLGAHAIAPEYTGRPDDYIKLVCETMIPEVMDLCTSVDVFCETIAFDLAQSRKVLQTAHQSGLKLKIHAEQLTHTGSAIMAAELGAVSADHLEYLSEPDCAILKKTGTVATLLPGAFYCLKEKQAPPIAALRRHNVPIAIATDSNPGSSPVVSILLIGNMACNLFEMTPAEALAGMTRNAAEAIGLGNEIGTIEVGKRADFSIWDVETPAELVYGIGHNPCVGVYKSGKGTLV